MKPRTLAPAAGLLAGLALLSGVACSSPGVEREPAGASQPAEAASPATPGASPVQQTATRAGSGLTTAELVKLAEPAVVRIAAGGGVGSGFVISKDGHIITNNHVVRGTNGRVATNIEVTMSDGNVLKATVVGTDPRSDLAVIKVEAENLKPLELASLANTQVGEDVVAIGYALDLKRGEGPSFSVTRGIVSAKNRGIDESATSILGAIQTDAAINHGNSGGPLLNLRGQVVGVNTALAPDNTSASGVASGIGFAVGADTIMAVYEQIRENGQVNRGLLGIINFESLRPAKAKALGLRENATGVYLDSATDIAANGPAATAGLKAGDVITKIGAYPVATEGDLAVAMIQNSPGKSVDVEVYRDGKKVVLKVTLGTPSTQ